MSELSQREVVTKEMGHPVQYSTHLDGPGVEDHAPEWAVLDVVVVVGDVDAPLARLVRLEGGEERPVLLAHRAAQRAVRRGVRRHLQINNGMVHVVLHIDHPQISSQWTDYRPFTLLNA